MRKLLSQFLKWQVFSKVLSFNVHGIHNKSYTDNYGLKVVGELYIPHL